MRDIRAFNLSLINRTPSQAATKFRKMQKDVMAFNRGLNHVFYHYVQSVGLPEIWLGPNSARAWLHGDFHVENIGAYQDAKGNVVVDLMDFDDSFQGPVLLDIYRCASSLYLAAKSDVTREKLVKAFVDAYLDTMEDIAGKKISPDMVLDASAPFPLVRTLVAKAAGADKGEFFSQFARCKLEDGKRVFVYSADYEKLPDATAQALIASYLASKGKEISFSREIYSVQDAVVEKGSGVGSAGAFKVRILVRGPTEDPSDDLVLEFKEENAPQGGAFAIRPYAHQGQRVLDAQRMLQSVSPSEIGTASLGDRQFFVCEMLVCYRELQWKRLEGFLQMKEAAAVAGTLLAKGHARGTADSGAVALEITQRIAPSRKKFLREVMDFCAGYEEFIRKGYSRFCQELTVSPILLILWGWAHAR